jgi:translation initiation factor SUI1
MHAYQSKVDILSNVNVTVIKASDLIFYNTDIMDELHEDVALENHCISIHEQHIRGRKHMTCISGLDKPFAEMSSLLKKLKKMFHCGGSIEHNRDDEDELILQIQGQFANEISNYFLRNKVCTFDQMKVKKIKPLMDIAKTQPTHITYD